MLYHDDNSISGCLFQLVLYYGESVLSNADSIYNGKIAFYGFVLAVTVWHIFVVGESVGTVCWDTVADRWCVCRGNAADTGNLLYAALA